MANNRKRLRHFHEPGHCHELTFSCYQCRPLLTTEQSCRLLSDAIESAKSRHRFGLVAFVLMPDHVHLLVFPRADTARVDRLLKAIKRPFSFRMKKVLDSTHSPLLEKLTVRERPGTLCFRFWQEGGGYDRNLCSESAVLAAIDYIHLNPVRRSLCEQASQWKWSSCRRFIAPGDPVDPDLPTIDRLPPGFFTSTRR